MLHFFYRNDAARNACALWLRDRCKKKSGKFAALFVRLEIILFLPSSCSLQDEPWKILPSS